MLLIKSTNDTKMTLGAQCKTILLPCSPSAVAFDFDCMLYVTLVLVVQETGKFQQKPGKVAPRDLPSLLSIMQGCSRS